ncbi:MAG: 50S ribosomal protein L9 [Patescibacteria group bacterium]
MKVILLQNVTKVGKKGEVVEVSDGFAVNSLLPAKKAIAATAKNLEALTRKRDSILATKALEHGLLEAAVKSLPDTALTIAVKANEKGHLFSKVDEKIIVEALAKHRIGISVKNVILDEPIKEVGSYSITVQEGDYKAVVPVVIIKE